MSEKDTKDANKEVKKDNEDDDLKVVTEKKITGDFIMLSLNDVALEISLELFEEESFKILLIARCDTQNETKTIVTDPFVPYLLGLKPIPNSTFNADMVGLTEEFIRFDVKYRLYSTDFIDKCNGEIELSCRAKRYYEIVGLETSRNMTRSKYLDFKTSKVKISVHDVILPYDVLKRHSCVIVMTPDRDEVFFNTDHRRITNEI